MQAQGVGPASSGPTPVQKRGTGEKDMAVIVNAGMRSSAKKFVPAIGTFVTTVVSGCIFMVIKMAMRRILPY